MIFFLALLALLVGKVANSAASAKTAHEARLLGAKLNRRLAKPHGNYEHSEFQFATVAAVHDWLIDGKPPSVDIYPSGSQHMSPEAIIYTVRYLASYAMPAVNDVVLVYRGSNRNRSSRIVLGKPNGSATPYSLPLGYVDSAGRWALSSSGLWGGPTAEPSVPAADPTTGQIGAQLGDWFLSTTEPVLWVLTSSGWQPVAGLGTVTPVPSDTYTLQASDAQTVLQFEAFGGCVLTVPELSLSVGTVFTLRNISDGPVTIVPGDGVTIESPGALAIPAEYGEASLRLVSGTDTYSLNGDVPTPIPPVPSTSVSLTAGLVGTCVEIDAPSDDTYYVDIAADITGVPVGAWFEVCQTGAGAASVSAGDGVTVLSPTGTSTCAGQYSTIRGRQSSPNTWIISGDLAT